MNKIVELIWIIAFYLQDMEPQSQEKTIGSSKIHGVPYGEMLAICNFLNNQEQDQVFVELQLNHCIQLHEYSQRP